VPHLPFNLRPRARLFGALMLLVGCHGAGRRADPNGVRATAVIATTQWSEGEVPLRVFTDHGLSVDVRALQLEPMTPRAIACPQQPDRVCGVELRVGAAAPTLSVDLTVSRADGSAFDLVASTSATARTTRAIPMGVAGAASGELWLDVAIPTSGLFDGVDLESEDLDRVADRLLARALATAEVGFTLDGG
jgi:hypothetical protein